MLRWMLFFSLLSLSSADAGAQFVYYVPQVVDGENQPEDAEHFFATRLSFVNFSLEESVEIHLELIASDGLGNDFNRLFEPGTPPRGAPGSSLDFELPPLGSLHLGTSNGPFRITGWARVESSGEIGVLATVQYITSGSQELVASASFAPEPLVNSFSTIALVRPLQSGSSTGIALLNPSGGESTEVKVDLYLTDGTFHDSRTITLEPEGKVDQFLNEGELFTGLEQFTGTAEISSTLPLAVTVIRVFDTFWSTIPIFQARVATP